MSPRALEWVWRMDLVKRRPSVSLLLLTFCLAVGMAWPSYGEIKSSQQTPSEYEMKAIYLFNFLRFASWPETIFDKPQSPLVIGIYGKDPFGSLLDNIICKKNIRKHPVEIKRMKYLKDIKSCHLLFISSSERKRLSLILKKVEKSCILTVSDIENFREQGGMIGFIVKKDKLRFEINYDAVNKSEIKLSSKLLSLAENKKKIKNGKKF